MSDAFSRRLLAVCLTFDPLSYRSCMLALRECVRRYQRLPEAIVVDGGPEFESVYFETLLARYGCTKNIEAVHRPQADTRDMGHLDPGYWGYRFSGRRSAFDLTAISQRWLRDLTWDYLAEVLDTPRHPRSAYTFEQIRRSLISLSAYLADCDPHGGTRPAALAEATAREFVADFTRRVTNHQPVRDVLNANSSPAVATPTRYALTMNAVRRVMRHAMDSGVAAAAQLPREFIVTLPFGGALSHRNPRPFSDPVLRALSDPASIKLLDQRPMTEALPTSGQSRCVAGAASAKSSSCGSIV